MWGYQPYQIGETLLPYNIIFKFDIVLLLPVVSYCGYSSRLFPF